MSGQPITDNTRLNWLTTECYAMIVQDVGHEITRASDGAVFRGDNLRQAIDNAIRDDRGEA